MAAMPSFWLGKEGGGKAQSLSFGRGWMIECVCILLLQTEGRYLGTERESNREMKGRRNTKFKNHNNSFVLPPVFKLKI